MGSLGDTSRAKRLFHYSRAKRADKFAEQRNGIKFFGDNTTEEISQ
jgi:hypothetical protein